jgi:hypothetical protein
VATLVGAAASVAAVGSMAATRQATAATSART